MDYFYKFVLKTLLLIGGIERNPGPKQGPPPLGITNNLEQSGQQKEPNVLQILQQLQERLVQIQGIFQNSAKEMKQTFEELKEGHKTTQKSVHQLQESHTTTQHSLQQIQQSVHQLQESHTTTQQSLLQIQQSVHQLQESHTTTQQSLQQIQQSVHQLQESHTTTQQSLLQIQHSVHQLQESHTTTQQSLQQIQQSVHQLQESHTTTQQSLEKIQQSCEQGQHCSHNAPQNKIQLRGLKELVALYRGYEDDANWMEILKLLEKSLDPSCVVYQQLQDINNISHPLLNVSGRGHLELLELLLDHGLDVNKMVDRNNSSLLHVAVFKGHVPVVKLLLQRGANVNKTDIGGDIPLFYSAYMGYLTICQLLVEAGCNPRVKNRLGITALDRARDSNHIDVVKYLSSLK